MSQKTDYNVQDTRADLEEKTKALCDENSIKTPAGTGINSQNLNQMFVSSIVAQQASTSLISEKLAALRAGIKSENTESKLTYVTQEDIEQGRDTSVLDNFIEDVIANRI